MKGFDRFDLLNPASVKKSPFFDLFPLFIGFAHGGRSCKMVLSRVFVGTIAISSCLLNLYRQLKRPVIAAISAGIKALFPSLSVHRDVEYRRKMNTVLMRVNRHTRTTLELHAGMLVQCVMWMWCRIHPVARWRSVAVVALVAPSSVQWTPIRG